MLTDFLAAPTFTWSMLLSVFAEGVMAFLSPCILPMLPVYALYLAGDDATQSKKQLILNTLCFVLGFTLVFMALGATATALGKLLQAHLDWLMRIGGVVLILLGLHYIGVLRIGFLDRGGHRGAPAHLTPTKALVFGATFAITWTPCVGTFLGAALMQAGQSASLWHGLGMLLCFSLGLGVPFSLVAIFYHKLSGTLGFIKRHLRVIQIVSGALLIAIGLMMALGWFGYWGGLFV